LRRGDARGGAGTHRTSLAWKGHRVLLEEVSYPCDSGNGAAGGRGSLEELLPVAPDKGGRIVHVRMIGRRAPGVLSVLITWRIAKRS